VVNKKRVLLLDVLFQQVPPQEQLPSVFDTKEEEGRRGASHEGHEVPRGFPNGKSPDSALLEERKKEGVSSKQWTVGVVPVSQACLGPAQRSEGGAASA